MGAQDDLPTRPSTGSVDERPTAVRPHEPAPARDSLAPIPGIEAPRAGAVLGDRYRLIRPLGSGGMGTVWLANHVAIDKEFAVKVLGSRTRGDQWYARRFLREAQAIARIKHPGIVEITDFGETPGGEPYFVMERVEGRTLTELVREDGALDWPRAREILIGIADALAAAHDEGIVHCDLKPSNVFVLDDPRRPGVKLIDFGLAKYTRVPEGARSVTVAGEVSGTPTYMSPEQAFGRDLDARSDIYSLGCVAYFLMAGHPPFEDGTMEELLRMHIEIEPTPLHVLLDGVPRDASQVVMQALQKLPSDRFNDARSLRRALEAARPPTAGPSASRSTVPFARAKDRPHAPRIQTQPSIPGATAGALGAVPAADTRDPGSMRWAAVGVSLGLAVAGGAIALALTMGPDDPTPGSTNPPPAPGESSVAIDTATADPVKPDDPLPSARPEEAADADPAPDDSPDASDAQEAAEPGRATTRGRKPKTRGKGKQKPKRDNDGIANDLADPFGPRG